MNFADFWMLLGPAVVAASVMSPVHALFGLHIVRRGLIFIDLAVAQVAALGMALALSVGHAPESAATYQFSVGFALAGALLISLSRFKLGRVPHEAIIGVVYVLATAASIVVLEFAPTGHGLEELKGILAGNIVFVQTEQVRATAITYAVILAALVALWRPITRMTLKEDSEAQGFKGVLLDFTFYALLGFVVASSVKIAGVLVVFAWLVMPAVVAFFFVERMRAAVPIAIAVGVLGSFGGLMLSFFAPAIHLSHTHDEPNPIEAAGAGGWPTGPAIVVALGAIVVLAYLVRLALPTRHISSAEHP